MQTLVIFKTARKVIHTPIQNVEPMTLYFVNISENTAYDLAWHTATNPELDSNSLHFRRNRQLQKTGVLKRLQEIIAYDGASFVAV